MFWPDGALLPVQMTKKSSLSNEIMRDANSLLTTLSLILDIGLRWVDESVTYDEAVKQCEAMNTESGGKKWRLLEFPDDQERVNVSILEKHTILIYIHVNVLEL